VYSKAGFLCSQSREATVTLASTVRGWNDRTMWGLALVETGKGFTYLVQGALNGMHLEAGGLIFEDEIFLKNFGYLDEKVVVIKTDRMDV
jgi:hypothetical protein